MCWDGLFAKFKYFERLGSCREWTGEITMEFLITDLNRPVHQCMDSLSVAQYAETSYPSIPATD